MSDDSQKLKIAMLVVDANDAEGSSNRDLTRIGPVIHPAIENLLVGLRNRDDVEVDVLYGKRSPSPDESRQDGSLHYVPVPYTKLPIPGMGGAYLGRAIALSREIKRRRPHVVHAQGTERESGLVAALGKSPSLLTLHGNFREIARVMKARPFSYLWLNSRLEEFAIRRVSGLLCISTYTQKAVSDLNDKLWTLPNAVHPRFFEIVNKPVEGRVICVAGIGHRKNQLAFLKACDSYAETNPSFKLEFWGPANEDHPYFIAFRNELSSRPWAQYCGSASVSDIPEIMTTADVLALPSLEDNCPVVILEAMAAGIPVVASGVGGIPDLVTNGKTGFIASPDMLGTQVDMIGKIIGNRKLRGELSENSKTEAQERFTSKAVAAFHVEVYKDLAVPY
jgi:glycosyltransferase involved in cell wall biosynthesis